MSKSLNKVPQEYEEDNDDDDRKTEIYISGIPFIF